MKLPGSTTSCTTGWHVTTLCRSKKHKRLGTAGRGIAVALNSERQPSVWTLGEGSDILWIMAGIRFKSTLERLDAARAAVVAIRRAALMSWVDHQPGPPVAVVEFERL